MMNDVDFKTSAFFSPTMILTAVGFLFLGLVVGFVNVLAGFILCLFSIIVFTTHYRLTINFNDKVYHDYVWIFGMKAGAKKTFEGIEYVFIKKNRVSQTMHLRVASSTVRKEVYDGFLKFSDEAKIHLLTADDKTKLIARLQKIADRLHVKILDYSSSEPCDISTPEK